MNGYAGDEAYDYPFDFTLANTTASIEGGIRTDTDSDFLLLGLTLNVFTSNLFSLQFKDSSGNYFSSKPILAQNLMGQGSAKYMFPGRPRIFGPGSSCGITARNFSGAENVIQGVLNGLKRYVPPRPICAPDTLTARRLMVR